MRSRLPKLLLVLAVASGIGLRAVYVARGHFYLDSGFYLHSARAVLEGKLPYRDFFFAQGPVYPYLYGATRALLLPAVGSSILAARLTSAVMGLLACAVGALLARRLAGPQAGLLAALLLFPNSFLAYCQCVEKLYAPAGLLLALGALAAVSASARARASAPSALRFAGAAVLLAVATALRLTLLPSIAALALLCLAVSPRRRDVLAPLLAFGATLAALFAPFLLLAPEALAYHTFGIHESAGADSPYHFGLGNKVVVLLVLCRDHPLLLWLLLAALPAFLWPLLRSRGRTPRLLAEAEHLFLWILAGLVGAANMAANWVHASYQTVVMPVAAAALAVTVARVAPLVTDPAARRGIAALLVAGAFLQPLAHGRRELWSRNARLLSPYAPEIVSFLKTHARPEEPVLVCNAAFAIEADRPVLKGSEGFPFSYTPAWPTERCHERVTLNNDLLIEAFRTQAPAAVALVKDQFRVGFPGFVPLAPGQEEEVWRALEESYELRARLPNPDATANDVLAYVRRRPEAGP